MIQTKSLYLLFFSAILALSRGGSQMDIFMIVLLAIVGVVLMVVEAFMPGFGIPGLLPPSKFPRETEMVHLPPG